MPRDVRRRLRHAVCVGLNEVGLRPGGIAPKTERGQLAAGLSRRLTSGGIAVAKITHLPEACFQRIACHCSLRLLSSLHL